MFKWGAEWLPWFILAKMAVEAVTVALTRLEILSAPKKYVESHEFQTHCHEQADWIAVATQRIDKLSKDSSEFTGNINTKMGGLEIDVRSFVASIQERANAADREHQEFRADIRDIRSTLERRAHRDV